MRIVKAHKWIFAVGIVMALSFTLAWSLGLRFLVGNHLYLKHIARTIPVTQLPVVDIGTLENYPKGLEYNVYGYTFKVPKDVVLVKKEVPLKHVAAFSIDGIVGAMGIEEPSKDIDFQRIFTDQDLELKAQVKEFYGSEIFRSQFAVVNAALRATPQARSWLDDYQRLTKTRIFVMIKVIFVSANPDISRISSFDNAGYRAFLIGDLYKDKNVYLHVFDGDDTRTVFRFVRIQNPAEVEKLINVIVQTFHPTWMKWDYGDVSRL
jgi:hypothetical protein